MEIILEAKLQQMSKLKYGNMEHEREEHSINKRRKKDGQTCRDRKQTSDCQGLERRGMESNGIMGIGCSYEMMKVKIREKCWLHNIVNALNVSKLH